MTSQTQILHSCSMFVSRNGKQTPLTLKYSIHTACVTNNTHWAYQQRQRRIQEFAVERAFGKLTSNLDLGSENLSQVGLRAKPVSH